MTAAWLKRRILASRVFHRLSVSYCAENALLPEVLTRTESRILHNLLLLPESDHTTQLNQDTFALLANRLRSGYFVEIGANDGFTLSNTLYLEEHFDWAGLLVEANPIYSESLRQRRAQTVIAAVAESEGYYTFTSAGLYGGISDRLDRLHESETSKGEEITVWGTSLSRILEMGNAPRVIDFISIDVEGGELPIVEQMCSLSNYRFTCGCIEHNGRRRDLDRMKALLTSSGYPTVWEGFTGHDLFFASPRPDQPL